MSADTPDDSATDDPATDGPTTGRATDPELDPVLDPVLEKRRRIERWCDLGKRIGYALYGFAIVAFFVGFATTWSGPLLASIIVAMAVGGVLLIPAIVFGYGVKAADRDDREQAAERAQIQAQRDERDQADRDQAG